MQGIAQVRSAMTISPTGGNQLAYQSQPTAFQCTIAGNRGPTPGQIIATVAGATIVLTGLSQLGGLCHVANLELSQANGGTGNIITIGIYNSALGKFCPLLDLLPQESYIIRLSHLITGAVGTGTGTVDNNDELRAKSTPAVGATSNNANLLVEAFDA